LIKNIIWDFDGTLFDTYPGMIYAFKRALKDSGVEISENEILKYMKVSVSNAINHFKENYALSNDFIEKYVYYEKNLDADKIMPFPFAKEICFEFKKSGGKNYILTHRGNSTFKFLKYHGMLECFEEIGTRHNGFKKKPDPEGFIYFIEKYHMDKGTVLAVGDRDCDILGAKEANIKAVFIIQTI
jgi:phosphoglycolate phosphatase-like HAD superfamily hydrolase